MEEEKEEEDKEVKSGGLFKESDMQEGLGEWVVGVRVSKRSEDEVAAVAEIEDMA